MLDIPSVCLISSLDTLYLDRLVTYFPFRLSLYRRQILVYIFLSVADPCPGGFWVSSFAVQFPQLVSGLALMSAMMDATETVAAIRSRIPEISESAQKAIRDSERTGQYDNEEYKQAEFVGFTL